MTRAHDGRQRRGQAAIAPFGASPGEQPQRRADIVADRCLFDDVALDRGERGAVSERLFDFRAHEARCHAWRPSHGWTSSSPVLRLRPALLAEPAPARATRYRWRYPTQGVL